MEWKQDRENADPVHTTQPGGDEGRRRLPPGVPANRMVRRHVEADPVRGNREKVVGGRKAIIGHHTTTPPLGSHGSG